MRNCIQPLAMIALMLSAMAAHAADVSVTVAGQIKPGVYGQVNIGTAPPPLVYAQPILVVPQPRPVTPIYMNVPPGHAKHWSKHCRKYNACGRPVYFVKTVEYEKGYKPSKHGYGNHQGDHDHDHGKHKKHKKDKHGHGHGHHKHDD